MFNKLVIAALVVVACMAQVVPPGSGDAPCDDDGSSPSDCTCSAAAVLDCVTPEGENGEYSGNGVCKRNDFLECKYKYQGGHYCTDVEKYAKSSNHDNYIKWAGYAHSGLAGCTGRMCIDAMDGGMEDINCYCPCKTDGDTCCKYSFEGTKNGETVTQYGCVASHGNDFFKSKKEAGTPIQVVPGYEGMCCLGTAGCDAPDLTPEPTPEPEPTPAEPTPAPPTEAFSAGSRPAAGAVGLVLLSALLALLC